MVTCTTTKPLTVKTAVPVLNLYDGIATEIYKEIVTIEDQK